jgi:energy-coupling factor transporter ATP-binding protein EcfA2
MTAANNIELLTAKEALERYVAYLIECSWCIDTSGTSMRGFQATSNREQALDAFALGFRAWALDNSVRVKPSEYAKFRKTLKQDIIERLPHVLGSSFRPTSERFFISRGAVMANTCIPFSPPVPADMPSDGPTMPAIHHEAFERLFPDATQRKYVIQFLAHLVQRPWERPQFGLIITGVPGCGKSTLALIMRKVLNNQYIWHEGNYSPLFKPFSEVFPNSLFVCPDDAIQGPNTYERLKHATTSDYQEVEIKGQQKTVLREVYARIVIINNHPFKLPSDDRRFFVTDPCEHRKDKEDSAEFFQTYYAWLDQPTIPALLHHWLMNVDLTGFLVGSTTQTAAHARMVDDSMSTIERLVCTYVEDKPIFHEAQLLDYLKARGVQFPKPDDVARTLTTCAGYQRKRRPVPGCERWLHLWTPPGKRTRSLTGAEEEAIRRACGADF